MKDVVMTVAENAPAAKNVYRMRLTGDCSHISAPGQFVNVKVDGFFLRRPLSVCDLDGGCLTLIYKTVGEGTLALSKMREGQELCVLTGLGNGYDLAPAGNAPLLIGGGAGVPPLVWLAKRLVARGASPRAVIGFNSADEVFCEDVFREMGVPVTVATADGSYGSRGFVTDALPREYSYFYCCGPEPMLKAVFRSAKTSGQFSFEERMGCGFGACMGCSCRTVTGYKRICKDGPVLRKEEIVWKG